MIKIIKSVKYDKKRKNEFYTVIGYFNSIRFIANLTKSKDRTIINWIRTHSVTLEEGEMIKQAGLREDQSILELLSESEKEIIIKSV